MKETLSGINY